MPFWADFYKYFTYAFKPDPLSRKRAEKTIDGVGITQPDLPDIRADNWWGGGNKGQIRLRDSNDFIDLSSVTNRQSRYKEYERLRYVSEVEAALDILADESCVSGDTLISTPFGNIPIQKLAETKKPGEKFLVYCYDFKKDDYTLGWGHDARKVKTAPTVQIFLDNGSKLILTEDHRVLLRNGKWVQAGDIKPGNELMPFYRVRTKYGLNSGRGMDNGKKNQFPRIFTFADGWKHERQFVDEWKSGGTNTNYDPRLKLTLKCLTEGIILERTREIVGGDVKLAWSEIDELLGKQGFSYKEIKNLNARHKDRRRVVGTAKGREIDVYDMSVDDHENFATDSCILHNCQLGDNGHTFDIICNNETVKKELEYLYHRLLKVDRKIWNWAKNLYCMGDWFGEIVIDPENPKLGVLKVNPLPADSIYRIETTKGKLLEFQQSKEGPDYISLAKVDVTQATDSELAQATAIRFAPEQIVHMRIGDDRKTFYPYGVSIIEPARGPANQLRLMEDAMLVYRLTRAPERRVFYIDVGSLPPNKAEAFIERLKDQLRKKKMYTNRASQSGGGGSVEERWHAPASDEDFWLPIRPNGNTRIETLPGAQNLGEVDDALYFRNKLLVALHLPPNYLSQNDAAVTKTTLSSQDTRFARYIERLQTSLADGLLEIAERHLTLRGFPQEMWEDLEIRMTSPSEWREQSRMEVMQARYSNAATVVQAGLMSKYDALVEVLKYQPDVAREMASRAKMQAIEDMKIQVIGSNPEMSGLGQPGQDDQEVGGEAGGPNPLLDQNQGGDQGNQGDNNPPPDQGNTPPPPGGGGENEGGPAGRKAKPQSKPLPEPEEEDIKKYDLEIRDFSKEKDEEEIDPVELGEL
jgi:hypothetical protein